MDGNYTKFFQQERLKQADKIIFMKFPRVVCFYRGVKRYFQNRNITRESMAKGCIEKMELEFMWWILQKGRAKERKNHYKKIIYEYGGKVIVLKNRKQVSAF